MIGTNTPSLGTAPWFFWISLWIVFDFLVKFFGFLCNFFWISLWTFLDLGGRCERLNVSPSLGTYKKSRWPVDASHLELHHLLYFIPHFWHRLVILNFPICWEYEINSSPGANIFPVVFLLQGWLWWSIKALKWVSGSCGGFGTLAKPARFAWNMTKAAWNPPVFPSIRLKLPKHLEDQRNIHKNVSLFVSGSLLLMVDSRL